MALEILYVIVAVFGVVVAVTLPPLPLAFWTALIALFFAAVQIWILAAAYAVLPFLCLALWQLEKREYPLPNIPRTSVEPSQPKAKEFAMGPIIVLLAAGANIACIIVIILMYYLNITEFTVNSTTWSYIVLALPATLVIVLLNCLSKEERPGSRAWRLVDAVPSVALLVVAWFTAFLSTFVIGLPSSIPTPVLTSQVALAIIWSVAAWTVYDVRFNQKRNMRELLVKYPNARIIFGTEEAVNAPQAAAGVGVSSLSLADALDSGNEHLGSTGVRRADIPVDFHIVPRIVMPNGDRIPLRRAPVLIDVTPQEAPQGAAEQGSGAPAPAGGAASV